MREIQEEKKARLFVADVDRVNRKESGGKEGCGGGELLKQKTKQKQKDETCVSYRVLFQT